MIEVDENSCMSAADKDRFHKRWKAVLIVDAVRLIRNEPDMDFNRAWMCGVHRYGLGKISGNIIENIMMDVGGFLKVGRVHLYGPRGPDYFCGSGNFKEPATHTLIKVSCRKCIDRVDELLKTKVLE